MRSGVAQSFSESTQSLIDNLSPVIFAMLPSEKSPEVELAILDLLEVLPFPLSLDSPQDMVSLLGPAFLLPLQTAFVPALEPLLRGATPSQAAYAVLHPPIAGLPLSNDHPLAMKAVDVLAAAAQVLAPDLAALPALRDLWALAAAFLAPENSPQDLTSCLSLASTLLEGFDDRAAFVVDAALPLLPVAAAAHDEFCRANAFYLLSRVIRSFPREVEPALPRYAELLREGLEGRRGDVGLRRLCEI